MTNSKTFEMTTGPFIPAEHAQYGLLPRKTTEGGEVFSFPAELSNVEDLIHAVRWLEHVKAGGV